MAKLSVLLILLAVIVAVNSYRDRDWRMGREQQSKNSQTQGVKIGHASKRRIGHGVFRSRCWVRDCQVCSRINVCKRCIPGYVLTKTLWIGTRCTRICPVGSRRVLRTCLPKRKRACRFIQHCTECLTQFPLTCTRCKKGWYRYKSLFGVIYRCIKECPRGFEAKNGTSFVGPTCSRVSRKCRLSPGCIDCQKIFRCNRCRPGLAILEGYLRSKCVRRCPLGFISVVANGTTVCKLQSKEGCFDSFCSMCKYGWYKLDYRGKLCHEQCPPGYYGSLRYCIRCPLRCEECHQPFSCDICEKGLAKLKYHKAFGSKCVHLCPRGYIKESINSSQYNICRKVCKVANCARCESWSYHGPYHCDVCRTGYHKLYIESDHFYKYEEQCLPQCPMGYHPKKNELGSSICRKWKTVISPTPMTDELFRTTTEATTVPDGFPTTPEGEKRPNFTEPPTETMTWKLTEVSGGEQNPLFTVPLPVIP